MAETRTAGPNSWTEELASLVDAGVRYPGDSIEISPTAFRSKSVFSAVGGTQDEASRTEESLQDQLKGFARAWGEMLLELGRGCRDIVQQSLVTEDSFLVQKIGGPVAKVSGRLSFLNDYLPEDRDPAHAWPVIFFVLILALAALSVNTNRDSLTPPVKEVRRYPPSASHIILPNGRKIAYLEQGVKADKARFTLIAPHPFLSSRLLGIPGLKLSLLEEFGVHLVTYDLPGFGESDPHPDRNLNSSALDMQILADSLGVDGKFWLICFSSGAIHAWAALRYIPDRVAGVAMIAPMVNPYEPSMIKEESHRIWGSWTRRRKLMFFLARRFPKFLPFFYRRCFLSGKHGQIDNWLSLSLGKRDKILTEVSNFEEFWHRDVEESIRQGNVAPFIEEAMLQVSNWGFSLTDLQVQRKCPKRGFLPWLKSMYSQPECKLEGFLGPLHVWQGMDDQVVPPSMTDYIARILPDANVHRLPGEGHFSFFFFCDECHRQVFSTIFGEPQGPVENTVETEHAVVEGDIENTSPWADNATE